MAKVFNFALMMAKFRQIWSHWTFLLIFLLWNTPKVDYEPEYKWRNFASRWSQIIFNEQIPASFCLFLSFSRYNFNTINWKKHRWCAWDLNLGLQDGRRRQNMIGIRFTSLCCPEFTTFNTSLIKLLLYLGLQFHQPPLGWFTLYWSNWLIYNSRYLVN